MDSFPWRQALSVPRSRIREVSELAAQAKDPLRLYFGESNVPTPLFIKEAAKRALDEGYTCYAEMQARYRVLRDLACERLRRCPRVQLAEPQGAFYVFPRIEGLGDSFEFCRRLLLEKGVGLAPGSALGAGGEGHVGLCFAVEESILAPALERLGEFLGG